MRAASRLEGADYGKRVEEVEDFQSSWQGGEKKYEDLNQLAPPQEEAEEMTREAVGWEGHDLPKAQARWGAKEHSESDLLNVPRYEDHQNHTKVQEKKGRLPAPWQPPQEGKKTKKTKEDEESVPEITPVLDLQTEATARSAGQEKQKMKNMRGRWRSNGQNDCQCWEPVPSPTNAPASTLRRKQPLMFMGNSETGSSRCWSMTSLLGNAWSKRR